MTNSSEFDTWLNEVVFDLDNFRTGTKGPSPRKTGKTISRIVTTGMTQGSILRYDGAAR